MQKEGYTEELKKEPIIVIPTLNEEEAIGKVLDELIQLGYDIYSFNAKHNR